MAGIERKDELVLTHSDIEDKVSVLEPKAGPKRKDRFKELRDMAQRIAEEAAVRDGELVIVDGRPMSNVEIVLRELMMSRRGADRQLFIELAYGKVPNETKIEGIHKVIFEVVHTDDWEEDPEETDD